MQAPPEDDDTAFQISHYKPDAWLGKHWWDETQNVPIPSAKAKVGALHLVWCEHIKDGVGWLLLAHFGILTFLLKTFPDELYWLAWGVFLLEGLLKLSRGWARDHFFRGVPCAYVVLNRAAAHKFMAFYIRMLVLAATAELGLYVPYIIIAVSKVHQFYHDDAYARRGAFFDPSDPYSRPRTTEMIISSCALICIHWGTSAYNMLAFFMAMGLSSIFPGPELMEPVTASTKPNQNEIDLDRLLCLTWWLHLVRHPYLSASVSSAQPGRCGLQGQWFESVGDLKRILEESITQKSKNLTSAAGLWVSQDMAMRALSSVSKHGTMENCKAILEENGLLLLVLIVEEGNPMYCKGLAASTIGTLANRGCFDGEQLANLADAIPALQRLARSEESELQEMAIGSLLNITLNSSQQDEALNEMLASPEDMNSSHGPPEEKVSSRFFVESLLQTAHKGTTMRCRVLASGLLACLASKKKVRDAILRSPDHDYVILFSTALRSGATLEVKRSAAGLLWELAIWEPKAVGSGPHGDRCIQALVGALREPGEPSVAAAAAGALASLARENDEFKEKIVAVEGCVEALIEQLRGKLMWRLSNHLLEVYGIVYNKVQEQAQAQAARALWTLASGNQKIQDFIARKGAIPEIVKLLTVRNPYVQLQAAAALDALAHKNKSIQDLIGLYYREAFTGLADLLNPTRRDISSDLLEVVLEKAALAVRSLAENHTPNAEKLLGSGATDQLAAILERDKEKKFAHSKVTDVVIEALASTGGASRRTSVSVTSSRNSTSLSFSGTQFTMPGSAPRDYTPLHSVSRDLNIIS
ncbi:unnamed protein product [Calypogeia fissa]